MLEKKMVVLGQKSAMKDHERIMFICPICKSQKELNFPKSIVNQSNSLTTISISKEMICDHHFQAFVDKNFKVRGYQKVDFEFKKNTTDLIDNTYNQKHVRKPTFKKKMTLQEIYEEFHEFIDESNEEFKEFIKKDYRIR